MTATMLDGIASGTHYRVTDTDGQLPGSVTDFVGIATFLIHQADQNCRIDGVGRLESGGVSVRFYQKDPDHEGRDVRVWHLRPTQDDQWIAEHLSGG